MAKDRAFYLSESDREVLNRVLRDYRSTPKQPMRRQEQDEHQAPEVYIAYPQDDNEIPGVLPSITKADGDLYYRPGKARCDIYRIVEDVVDEPELRPLCGDECFSYVYNILGHSLDHQFFPVLRDKFGRWIAMSGPSLVGVKLAGDHGGYKIPFEVYLGTRSGRDWAYDYAKTYTCQDNRWGVPYPDAGATGLAVWINLTELEIVSLDCTSPGTAT